MSSIKQYVIISQDLIYYIHDLEGMMKKAVSLVLVVLMVTSLFGCASQTTAEAPKAETLTGTGEGFGGEVTVTVTKEGDKITNVEAVGANETAGIGDKAIKELPSKIVEANSTEVDVIAGATFTSKGIIYAVNNALDPAKYPWPAEEPKAEEPKTEAPGKAGAIAKIGLGQNISIAKSTDATADATATAQADVTIAAVGFDAEGKVASVTIDVAQTKVAFDKDMKVTTDRAAEVKSKKDLGPEYGMVKASSIGKEWYEQMGAFENWMIGKTADEITGLKVKARDENHPAVPDIPELTSSVTISVDAYLEAVEEAWNNAEDAAGAAAMGLGVETHIGSSKDKAADVAPMAQMDTYMNATAVDKDGKVVKTIVDVAQVKVNYDENGVVTSDKTAAPQTKKELKEGYGMVKASSIGKEWYEQMEAFEEWMAGKTVDEITGLKVKKGAEGHDAVPDVPELTSSVTITVEGYQAVVAEAIANARKAGPIVKVGLGQNISIAKSTDATADATATAQADVTIAAVGFDAEGKVASVTIDVAQTKVAFDKDMKVTTDRAAEVKSKKDLGPEYGMVKASSIGKEWYEQMGAFENWMIGKTADEITGLKVKARDENHPAVPDIPELTSSVTISVDAYLEAVEEAWNNAEDAAGAAAMGLGVETHIGSSKDKAADVAPMAQMDTYMNATAVDKDGKVVKTIVDVAQVKVNYDENGVVTSDKTAAPQTKKELKEGYGMVKASSIGKEWYEQMEAFEEWMAGKTVDEITGLKVKKGAEGHDAVPDVPELTSSVTITVEGYQSVIAEAIANVR